MYYVINSRTGLIAKPTSDRQQAVKESDMTGIAHYVRGVK